MKLELGCGHRPTRGYVHNDLYPFDHIEHPGNPWDIDLPDESLEEVLALGFVEHLTFFQALDTFRNMRRMLIPGGLFLFDVPDYPVWVGYYLAHLNDRYAPIPMADVRKTLFGWQRWPGDEHNWGWDREHLAHTLGRCGFSVTFDVGPFRERAHRDRFDRPDDAHLYAVCR